MRHKLRRATSLRNSRARLDCDLLFAIERERPEARVARDAATPTFSVAAAIL